MIGLKQVRNERFRESFLAAEARAGLVKRKVPVRKGGKTFMQYKWVKPGGAANKYLKALKKDPFVRTFKRAGQDLKKLKKDPVVKMFKQAGKDVKTLDKSPIGKLFKKAGDEFRQKVKQKKAQQKKSK